MPADNAVAAEGAPATQNNRTPNQPTAIPTGEADGAAQPAEGQPVPDEGSFAERLMDSLGIEGDIRDVVRKGQKEEKAEVGTQKEEVQEAESEEQEQDQEQEQDAPEAQGKEQWPKEAIALKDKYRRQRNEARDEADELRERIAGLENQVNAPAAPMPTRANPLAGITNLTQLEQVEATLEIIEDQCTLKPNGWIANEGQDTETFITPEMVAEALVEARRALRAVPKKERELTVVRPKFDAEAEKILPGMFKPGSEDHQAMQRVLKSQPWVLEKPDGMRELAVYLRGWKQVNAEQGQNGSGTGQRPSLQDVLPPELVEQHRNRGKVPILKQSPPGRPSGSASPNGGKAVNEAMQAVIDGDDGAEGIGKAFAAMRAASSQKSSPRSPVAV
jgi:hypothetical protein